MNRFDFETKKPSEDQLGMNISRTKNEGWFNFKYQFAKWERMFESLPFWRIGVNAFAIVTIVMTFNISLFMTFVLWNSLPDEVPLFYSQSISNWLLYPKETIILLIVSLGVLQLSLFYVGFKVFSHDRRLVTAINSIIILCSVLFFIAISQLLSLVLI